MEAKMYKFPSIEQFRTAIHQIKHRATYRGDTEDGDPIYDTSEGLMPTLEYRGTVKMHGTNAAIVFQWDMLKHDYVMHAQSRENVITPLNDNAGFAAFAHTSNTEAILNKIEKELGDDMGYTPEVIRVYGEWCGGNIQKGIALNGLEKMFVIFAIKVDNKWLDDDKMSRIKLPEQRIYNILDYPSYTMTIDFNNPEQSTNKLVELTNAVEAECPVGKAFGNDVMINNTAYEEDGKIWFDRENKFTDKIKEEIKPYFSKLREEKPNGVNYIKFNLVE